MNTFGEDDYVLFDCPGQIELYTHLDLVNKLTGCLQKHGFSLCSVYMIDITFINQNTKFISGLLSALSAMISLALPHLNVLTKCDLVKNKDLIESYLNYAENLDEIILKEEKPELGHIEKTEFEKKYFHFTKTLQEILQNSNMLTLLPLDLSDEETIKDLIAEADFAI